MRDEVGGHPRRERDPCLFPLGLVGLFVPWREFARFGEVGGNILGTEYHLCAGGTGAILDEAFVEGKPSTKSCVGFEQMNLKGGREQALVLREDEVT